MLGKSIGKTRQIDGKSLFSMLVLNLVVQGLLLGSGPTSAGQRASSARGGGISAQAPADTRPLLVCTTAPSLEGVAFCKHVCSRGNYRVRALVRNLESPRAEQLASMGAELWQADNFEIGSLREAFAGAHGIYGITTWSGASRAADGTIVRPKNADSDTLEEGEYTQGCNIILAASETAGLQHFVWQSMHKAGKEPIDPTVRAPLHHRAKWRLEAVCALPPISCSVVLNLVRFPDDRLARTRSARRASPPVSHSATGRVRCNETALSIVTDARQSTPQGGPDAHLGRVRLGCVHIHKDEATLRNPENTATKKLRLNLSDDHTYVYICKYIYIYIHIYIYIYIKRERSGQLTVLGPVALAPPPPPHLSRDALPPPLWLRPHRER